MRFFLFLCASQWGYSKLLGDTPFLCPKNGRIRRILHPDCSPISTTIRSPCSGHAYAPFPKILNAYSAASAKDCPPLPTWLNAGNFIKIDLPTSAES